MGRIKDICRDMKQSPHVLTFTDIAQALANGAAMGQKANEPLVGAVLNLSLEAGKRAVHITKDLLKELDKKPNSKVLKAETKLEQATKPRQKF